MKLIVERSEASGDWWVRCVARNGRIVGTSQEGYRNRAHAEHIASYFATQLAACSTDPEGSHCEADDIVEAAMDPDLAAAYRAARERCGGWWYS